MFNRTMGLTSGGAVHTQGWFGGGAAGAIRMTESTDDIPRLAGGAERIVYQRLREQLQTNDRVIPGQRVTDHLKDYEIDFVVAIEGASIVCLKVKGGEVWHDGDSWRQWRGGREQRIDPVRQARDSCYALREFVEQDPRRSQGRLRWDHVVVLPHAEIGEDFALPECPRSSGGVAPMARPL